MNRIREREKAQNLFSLHTTGRMLILPNIWNPIGARILEAKGYPVVATSSSAISTSLGYEDGEKINLSTLISTLSRIAASVTVPVTADIESGYGESNPKLEETILQVIDAGIVGINIEDSLEDGHTLRPVEQQCKRITAIREVSVKQNIHLVINARTDCFLSNIFSTNEAKIEESVTRAKAYCEAGADCVYPIGPGDIETVKELRQRIESPMNILAASNAAPLPVLQEIGVNRVSFGPFVFRSCLKKFVDIVDSLYELKSYDCFGSNMMSKADTVVYLKHELE